MTLDNAPTACRGHSDLTPSRTISSRSHQTNGYESYWPVTTTPCLRSIYGSVPRPATKSRRPTKSSTSGSTMGTGMSEPWPISEKQFQDQVIALAILHGWKVHHVRPGMSSTGRWLTHVQGHVGFPDLVMAHERHGLLFVECKTVKGRLTEAQVDWCRTLDATGAETYVWRPTDLHFIQRRLKGIRDANPTN